MYEIKQNLVNNITYQFLAHCLDFFFNKKINNYRLLATK